MLSNEQIIARYYVGYYNRAPDPSGFDFWLNAHNDGITTLEIAEFFSQAEETVARYPYFADPENASPSDFVTSVYHNLFNRDPDESGLEFWVNVISSGEVTTGQMIELIIRGATTNPDQAVVENKVSAAIYWESRVDDFGDFEYSSAAAESALRALDVVTDDVGSVDRSRMLTDEYVATLGDPKSDPTDDLTDDAGEDDKSSISETYETKNTNEGLTIQLADSDDVLRLDDLRADSRFGGMDGSGYTVAVLDTGIDLDHVAFGPDTDSNGVADRIVAALDFTGESDGTANDIQGHGTHVAGIVGSSASGYMGVAPGVNIAALQVLDSTGVGYDYDIEQALQWVVQNAEALNIVAVNMSLGDGTNGNAVQTSGTYGDEFRVLQERLGIPVVVAAGNEYHSVQAEGASTIARDPNSFAIGASGGTTATGELIASFSQRSNDIPTIFAPGEGIESARAGGGTTNLNGTSMAAPQVAGMVALGQQIAVENLGRRLSTSEIEALLAGSAVDFVDHERANDGVVNTGVGYDRVDMLSFAESILALGQGTPPPPPSGESDSIAGDTSTHALISVDGDQASTIDYSGDQDFFRIDLTPGTYTFALQGSPSGAGTLSDPFLVLYSEGGAFITSDDDSGLGYESELEFSASQSGTYYLSAGAYGSATGTYTLSATQEGSFGGEVRDDIHTGASLSVGSQLTNEIDFGSDRDWFRIDLVGGQTYTFDLVGDTLSDPYLALHDADGSLIRVDDDSGEGLDSQMQYVASRSGSHFLEARAYASSQTGSYTLSASSQETHDDYGDAPEAAGFIPAVGGRVVGNLEQLGDTDLFRAELQANSTYVFTLEGDQSSGELSDPFLRLFNLNGDQIASDDDSLGNLDSTLTFTTGAAETVFLSAEGYASNRAGTYVLSSSLMESAGEIPSDPSTPATIRPGQVVQGVIDMAGDTDWYGVNVQAGATYTFDLTPGIGAPRISDPFLVLFNGAGHVLEVNDDGGPGFSSSLVFQASVSETLFISAETYSPTSDQGSYTLSLTTSRVQGASQVDSQLATFWEDETQAVVFTDGDLNAPRAVSGWDPEHDSVGPSPELVGAQTWETFV